MLNESSESRNPWLVPDQRRKHSDLNMMLGIVFFRIKTFSFITSLLTKLFHEKYVRFLSDALSTSIVVIILFFIFS